MQQQCTRWQGIALFTIQCNAALSSAMPLSNKPMRGAAYPIAAPMRFQPSYVGQPCTSEGA